MAKLVFRLNGVTEEEADEVRALLEEEGFETYETHAGRWGISMAGIWLVNDADKEAARERIDVYQAERQRRMQEEYRTARAEGRLPRLRDRLREDPFTFVTIAAAVLVVSAISLVPFFRFVGG